MTDTLNPNTLKALRTQRGWSQDRLHEESNISKSQISRWERGQQTEKIHQTNRERLCRALGVKWETLTRRPTKPSPSWLLNRVPLKAGIDAAAKTALTLIRYHYRLQEEAILDLAPLAFCILAERSLRARRQALDAAVKAMDEATKAACDRLPYLLGALGAPYDDAWTKRERESIERDDVFATYTNDEGDELSPFVDFLEKELADLGVFQQPPLEFSPSYWSAPDYAIPAETLGVPTGLDPEKDDDWAILDCIRRGSIDLEEVFNKKGEATDEEYRRWLTERHQAVDDEISAGMPELHLKLDLASLHERSGKSDPGDGPPAEGPGEHGPTANSANPTTTEDPA
jgi:transcriptional regulator with XRE-family HTH domain